MFRVFAADYWVKRHDGAFAVFDASAFIKGGFECEADAEDYIREIEDTDECDDDDTF
jgi:hypothetical protein